MVQYVIPETIITKNIAFVILQIDRPVIPKTPWTQNKHSVIPQFVIFDDCERFKCFAQADTVGDDAAIIFFQLVDCAENSIFLELVKFFPDQVFFDPGFGLDDFFLIQFPQSIAENMIQNEVIDKVRCFVTAEPGQLINKIFFDILNMLIIMPDCIKPLLQFCNVFRVIKAGTHVMPDGIHKAKPGSSQISTPLNSDFIGTKKILMNQ